MVADGVRNTISFGPALLVNGHIPSSIETFQVTPTSALLALHAVIGSLALAALGAQAISSSVNFATNRNPVFSDHHDKHIGLEAGQYWALVVLLWVNVALLSLLTQGYPSSRPSR